MKNNQMRYLYRLSSLRWIQNLLLIIVGIPAAKWVGEYTSDNPTMLLQLAIVILVLIPAFILASTQSNYLIPYVTLIWLIGPEIRRLADWAMDDFGSLNLLSLLPLLTTSMIFFSLVQERFVIETRVAHMLKAYLIPFVYAACIGLVLNKLGGIFSIANYFVPLLIFIYLVIHPPSDSQKDGWMRFYVTVGVLLSIYSWFQYLYLPPWDRFWMEGAKMASLGQIEPMGFRVFSTLNATGTFAVFIVSALVPAIVNKAWRGIFGFSGIFLLISALALTLVRASWVTLIAGIVAYFLFSTNTKRWQMFLTIGVLIIVGMIVFPYLPGGQELTNRLDTFGNLEQDHSTNVRTQLVLDAIPEVLRNPLGSGLGSVGISSSLSGNQGAAAGLGSVDNGYLGIFAVFGLFGGTMLLRAFYIHWRLIAASGKDNRFRAIGLTIMVQILVGFLFGGELISINALVFWLFTGLVFNPVKRHSPLIERKYGGEQLGA